MRARALSTTVVVIMKFPTVILYSRDGYEIARETDIEGMKRAKERARHLLSDRFAVACETTHERLRTAKVAIFAEGEETGFESPCEWDAFHPGFNPDAE